MAKQLLRYKLEEYIQLIAIATPLKDYRVAFLINDALFLQLEKATDISIDHKAKSQIAQFGRYFFEDETSQLSYHMIENKSENGCFIKSLKKFDYFFIVKRHEEEAIDISSLVEKLKQVDAVQIAIPVDKLKKSETKFILQHLPLAEENNLDSTQL